MPGQSQTQDTNGINLLQTTFLGAAFPQLHDQSCFPVDCVGVKDKSEELQQLSKDSVINSTTVDQGLITSAVRQKPKS